MKWIQKVSFFGKQITIIASEKYVEVIRLTVKDDDEKTNAVTMKVASWLKKYENGQFSNFDFNLVREIRDPKSKADQVYISLIKVKEGKTITYKNLANSTGFENASRFIGSCMARNPLPIIIPCHRVIKSDLSLGEYSFEGPAFKAILLAHEQKV